MRGAPQCRFRSDSCEKGVTTSPMDVGFQAGMSAPHMTGRSAPMGERTLTTLTDPASFGEAVMYTSWRSRAVAPRKNGARELI